MFPSLFRHIGPKPKFYIVKSPCIKMDISHEYSSIKTSKIDNELLADSEDYSDLEPTDSAE
jgi:hypothetical protein